MKSMRLDAMISPRDTPISQIKRPILRKENGILRIFIICSTLTRNNHINNRLVPDI